LTYLVLARKYRPRTFEEVVGQSHVTRTLANAIESGRVGHAYLFSGPRGVGKTTTARLMAKSLNCPNARGAISCNECDVCREITNGTSLDVIEIDAASNRGIDEIRNLRENVKYAPAGGKCKVYVVDEVHMLTEAAFNALLKTLEEPPAHVKFILATTAPLKVPETILSRCQRFEFVRIPTKSILSRLKEISDKEGFTVGEEVLMMLSRRANGSLRDAESMLDQLVSAGLQEAGEDEVARLLGLSGAESFFSILDAVKAEKARAALETLGELFDKGTNLDEFADGLLTHLRNLLLIKVHPDLASLVEASSGHLKRYEEQAGRFTEGDLLRLIGIASKAAESVRRSELPRLHLETAVVEMAYLDSTVKVSELLDRLTRLEADLKRSDLPGARAPESRPGGAIESVPAAEEGLRRPDAEESPPSHSTAKRTSSGKGREGKERTSGSGSGTSGAHGGDDGKNEIGPPDGPSPEETGGAPSGSTAGKIRDSGKSNGSRREGRADSKIPAEDRTKWREVVKRIDARKKTLGVCLSIAQFCGISQGKVIVGFGKDRSFERSFVESKENRDLLKEELADVFKVALGFSCAKIESEPVESADELEPEGLLDDEEEQDDGSVKSIIDFFDGEIIH
jgi:DNA polymerase-3 subunit gamma/tau